MKKILSASLISIVALASVSSAAPKAAKAAVKPAPVNKVVVPVEVKAAPVSAVPAPEDRGFIFNAGLMGGAAAAAAGYRLPLGPLNASLSAGYGSGNKYTETIARFEMAKPCGPLNCELSIDYFNYSVKVRNLFGVSGDVDGGPHLGLGIYLNKNIDRIVLSLGYGTAAGALATIGYKF
ncbi:MAG TPA: hypothetical protein VMD02_03620 [Candidatus Omnitrophota bacterium]|nr:hypothetical protein [Candidatus Omnitrophota bacterium]